MSTKSFLVFLLLFCSRAESANLLERSYEYVLKLGKNLAPSLMSILDCFGEDDAWNCARTKASRILDGWDEEVEKQRRSWQDAADGEIISSGRSLEEMPSKIGKEIEESLTSIADMVQHGVARGWARKKHDSSGIDSITISTSSDKTKMKKKKKPAKIQLIQPVMLPMKKMEKGRGFGRVQSWVIGREEFRTLENEKTDSNSTPIPVSSRRGKGLFDEVWKMGDKALDAMAQHALESDNAEDGVAVKSSVAEQRGKKKKKKKAILKLLILGAVLKAKIGTLLQILSFKLQVKFFLIALIGLGINLARFWIELKNKHQQQPQKVIYYEHAQHQHHYEHEDEPGWGPWSRSMEPEDADLDTEVDVNTPYRAQEKTQNYVRPLLTRV